MGNSRHIAYAAGLIEGDGSFNLVHGRSRGADYFVLSLAVKMRERKPLDRLVGVLGGTIRPSWQPEMWTYQVVSRQCAKACKLLLPFLTSKREQAELAIQFQKHMDDNRKWAHRAEPPAAILSARVAMCDRMKLLHVPHDFVMTHDVGVKKDELLGYAAGLIDAEGSITIIKSGRGMLPAVLMQMTERAPMERLVRIFGGHLHEETRRTKRGKQVYSWRLTSNNASEACKQLMTYLVAKRTQAEIIVRFQNNVNLWMRRLGFGNKYIPDQVRAKRAQMITEVRALNSRHKFAAAETESRHPHEGSDSPVCVDGKDAECSRNDCTVAVA